MTSFQLSISIDGSYPAIIRTVAVPCNASFNDLNSTIQSVFSWSDIHDHVFMVGGRKIGPKGHGNAEDEDLVPLSDHVGDEIHYTYDMKDGWGITVIWEEPRDDVDLPWALLTGWSGESPPEDCGNIATFYAMMDAADDPGSKDYKEAMKVCGDLYFDEDAVTASLEAWPVQGVRPKGAVILPQGVRIAIMGNVLAFHEGPMVYDRDDMEVRLVRERAPKSAKNKKVNERPLLVSPTSVAIEPRRYVHLSPTGVENMATFMNGYAAEYPDLGLPHVEPDRGSIGEFLRVINSWEMETHLDRYILDRASLFPFEWARENGYYFKDYHDYELGSATDMARMIRESGEDIDDPKVVDSLIERYIESRKLL